MNVFGYNTDNQFDQSLNTVDSVEFASVTLTDAIINNSQATTKLYVDSNIGGGGITYSGINPATNKIYKASNASGSDAIDSTISDNGTLLTTTLPFKCSSITKNVDSSNFDIGDSQLTVDITSTNGLTANKVAINGGTNVEYMMSDGSLLLQSAQNGNSNFYLYNNINGLSIPPPANGDVSYNATTLATTTIVYISHLTRDSVDIDVYLALINTLDDLYIQDQNNSVNFARFNIISAPTLIPNDYISIPVAQIQFGGTGNTAFGANQDILVAFFSNSQEVNTRITALETATQNQTAVSLITTFNNQITVPILRVQGIASQSVNINDYTSIGTGNNYVQISSVLGMTANNYIVNSATSSQFLKGDGSLDSNTYLTSATAPNFQGYPFNPQQNSITTLTAGNKSYFYTVRINRPTTINGFTVYNGSGSDPVRCAIYRNFVRGSPLSNATLVGQSISTSSITGLPYLSGTIVAVSSQNLNFTTGEYMIIAFGSSGSTNTFYTSASTTTNYDQAFISTTNYVSAGFPATLTTSNQSASLLTKICLELY